MRPQSRKNVLDYNRMSTTPTNVLVPILHKKMIRYLSNKTRIRQAEFMREAIKDLLIKYRQEFKGSEFEF